MKRAWARWGVPLALAAAVGVLAWLNLKSRPPLVPADSAHPPGTAPLRCLDCHGAERPQARPPEHPRSDRCFDCHAPAPAPGG